LEGEYKTVFRNNTRLIKLRLKFLHQQVLIQKAVDTMISEKVKLLAEDLGFPGKDTSQFKTIAELREELIKWHQATRQEDQEVLKTLEEYGIPLKLYNIPGLSGTDTSSATDTASESEGGQTRLTERISYLMKENKELLDKGKQRLYNLLGKKPLGSSIPQWISADMRENILKWRQSEAKKNSDTFENIQMGYSYKVCDNCKEAVLWNNQVTSNINDPFHGTHRVNEPFICHRCGGKGHVYDERDHGTAESKVDQYFDLFSSEKNNSCPCEVPPELSGLSEAEEMLIARIQPLIKCTHLKGGVLSMSGHTCGYYQDATPVLNVLPRIPEEVTEVSFSDQFSFQQTSSQFCAFNLIFSQ